MSVRTLRRTHATRLARWGLLCLEDRITPTINFWTGNAGTTNWADANNWSEFRVPTSDDDAYVNTAVTVTHASGTDNIKSLNVDGNAVLVLSGGSLASTTHINAPAGLSDLVLSGGTLVGGTVTAGSEVIGTDQGGVLSGVTLAGTLNLTAAGDVRAAVVGGLTLASGTVLLGSDTGNGGVLSFNGTQTLGGTGTIVFGNSGLNYLQAGPSAGSALTIGPDVLVRGYRGHVGFGPGGSLDVTFINQGTIQADGDEITLLGNNWANTGTVRAINGGSLDLTSTTIAAPAWTSSTPLTISGGGSLTLSGNLWATAGITVDNSTLNLGGTFTAPGLGTVNRTGGTINFKGSLANTGNTLTLDATTGSWNLLGGIITGGTVTTTGGSKLIGTRTIGTLDGVTLAGTLDLTTMTNVQVNVVGGLTLAGGTVQIGGGTTNYALLNFTGGSQTLGGTGNVVFGNHVYNGLRADLTPGSGLTIGPGVVVHGQTGTIGWHSARGGSTAVTITNLGTIDADTPNGTIRVVGDRWTNQGTLRATGGSLELASSTGASPAWSSSTALAVSGSGTLTLWGDGWHTAGLNVNGGTVYLDGTFVRDDLGVITRTGGTVRLRGTLDNAGQTLVLDATTGSWELFGGTIISGTVTTTDGARLVGTSGTLANGVTLAGTLDLTGVGGPSAFVSDGLTLDNGTVLIGNDTGDFGYLSFGVGAQTLGGTGTVRFGRSGEFVTNSLHPASSAGSSLTIGPNILIHGYTGAIGYNPGLENPPDIFFTNLGTIQADMPGGTLTVKNATNLTAGTLTGGTWKAVDGTLRLLDGGVTANAADIVLDGANAHFYSDAGTTDALAALGTNLAAGRLTILNGQNQQVSTQFTNAGRLMVGPGSTFAVAPGGTYTQTDGTTTIHGTLSSAAPVDVQGGLLEGTGTIAADLTNAGTVNPGPGIGMLTVAGNYSQTAAGALAIDVGGLTPGTQHDRLNVGGLVSLDGALDVNLVNEFVPLIGDGFAVFNKMSAGGIGGSTFAGLDEGAAFDAGLTRLQITYAGGSGNDVGLTVVNRAPTLDPLPDPATILEDATLQMIDLTGIGTGNVEPQGLTVTAVSDNPTLIPHPMVTYTSPNATGSLSYTPLVNMNGTATVTVTVTDDGGIANGGVNFITHTFTVTVVELNDAPTLDVIPDPNAILEDATLQTVNLTGISAGGGETQTLTVTATSSNLGLIPNPVVTYTSANPTGTLSYTPVANQHGTATITVTVKDSGGTEFGGIDDVVRLFTVTVLPVPDAPAIDPDPLTTLTPVPMRLKPTDAPAGTLVSDLLTSPTDLDGEPVGITITGFDPANTVNTRGVAKFGVWQFSTDGTNWNPIPLDVSPTAALVLSADATTRVRFLPNLRFQGLSHFTFRAWDHSDTAVPGSRVDMTLLPTAYGTDPERAWVAVGRTKPPVTADGATLLTAVKEDARWSRVFPVKTLLGLAGLEALPATGLGLAITGQSSATGIWQYRLAKTKEFLPIDPVSPTNALLLRPTDQLRFIPAANANGTGGLTFKVWVPDATFGTYADTTGFGVNSGAAVIPIKAVNDAPVVNPALRPDLGTLAAGGTSAERTVGALLAMQPGLATDVDTAALGIQLFPASARVGKWQYFDGTAWKDVTTARKLAADVQVRFQAAAGAVAGTYNLGFKLWDGKLLSKLKGEVTVTIG